jgi:hypothetical protein
MKNKYFVYEIYVCNQVTGQTGWDIKFIGVKADTRKEAREKLNKFPHFDCVILWDFESEYEETADFFELDGHRGEKIVNRIEL